MSVRPEFGPSLPALLGARGVSRRAMAIGAAVLVLLAAAAWLLVRSLRDRETLVADGPPVVNLAYAPSALHEAKPREDEIARLVGRRKHVAVEITVRPITVPRYARADVIGGYLPVLAERRLHELRDIYGPIQVYDEGKSRVNLLPGYQIGFAARTPQGRPLFGRDTYVFPDDPAATEGVLLSLRRVLHGKQRAPDTALFDKAKEASASFAFGRSQP
ncbi:MAG: hypothetical protein JWM73_11 [Solirubrobacterales bacterium]|nr:hypothetical protein [Solirubrobacterales bacterium]